MKRKHTKESNLNFVFFALVLTHVFLCRVLSR